MKTILSIDGGGIRGILPVFLLAALEEKIQKKKNSPDAKIGEFVDLIAGTSTGGIIAALLLIPGSDGKPKYSAKEAKKLYLTKGCEIFSNTMVHEIKSLGGMIEEQYSDKNLEELLKLYFQDFWLKDLLKPCLITTYDIERRKAHFFNMLDANNPKFNFKVWEIARATSAAPTFFEPALIHNELGERYSLIDGGVFANNPTLCAYVEGREYFTSDNGLPASAKDMLIISLGTGSVKKSYDHKKAKKWGVAMWLKPLIDVMMSGSSEVTDFQLKSIFASEEVSDQYIRVEPSIGAADVQMDNVSKKNIDALAAAGEHATVEYNEKLDEIADLLLAYR